MEKISRWRALDCLNLKCSLPWAIWYPLKHAECRSGALLCVVVRCLKLQHWNGEGGFRHSYPHAQKKISCPNLRHFST